MSNDGAICGGLISEKFWRSLKGEEHYGYMMCYVMPTRQFNQYKKLKEAGQHKEASKLHDKYAWSMI